jgi:hypothetical protein
LTGEGSKADNDEMNASSSKADLPFADAIPPEVMADLQTIVDSLSAGRPIPPEVVARVRERGDRLREEIYQKHGLLDIGVPAIRELRGELPE